MIPAPSLEALARVEQLATASRWQRFLHRPMAYLYAICFRTLIYPRQKRGVLRTAETFFGRPMQVLLPAGTDIYLVGGKSHDSEIRLARFLIRRLGASSVFWDIGAHLGYFSLLAASIIRAGSGKIVSVEASGQMVKLLETNVLGNMHVQVLHRAVAAKAGTVVFHEFPVLYSEYNALDVAQYREESWYKASPPQRTEVTACSLSDLAHETQAIPEVIKIDVEGAEDQAIAGGETLLTNFAPLVVMEYLAPERHNETHRRAAELLRGWGYASHLILPDGSLQACADLDAHLAAHGVDSDNVVFVKAQG